MAKVSSIFRSVFSKEALNIETNPLDVVRALGPSLVPFFKTVAIYFVLARNITNRPLFAVIKCLPIISLIIFVVMHHRTRLAPKKMGDLRQLQLLCFKFDSSATLPRSSSDKALKSRNSKQSSESSSEVSGEEPTEQVATETRDVALTDSIHLESSCSFFSSLRSSDSRYARMVLIGLLLSLAGDICLVWSSHLFLYGLILFALAHCAYAGAFSFRPLNMYGFLFVLLVGLAYHSVMQVNFTGVYALAAPCYSVVIGTMWWRAISRLKLGASFWEWTCIASCFGATSFAVSDGLLAAARFAGDFAYAEQLIMLTYYAAQFGIAVSVIDTHRDHSTPTASSFLNGSSSPNDTKEKKNA